MSRAALTAGAVAVLLLGACGGDAGDPDSSPDRSSAARRTDESHDVAIRDFRFSPTPLKIPRGATVTWTNADSAAHSVVARPAGSLDSPDLAQGETYTFTASQTGTVDYVCGIHNYMTGQLVVG